MLNHLPLELNLSDNFMLLRGILFLWSVMLLLGFMDCLFDAIRLRRKRIRILECIVTILLTPLLAIAIKLESKGNETIAGLILDRLGHIPLVGETIEEAGYRFEIIMMDGRRISRIHCTKIITEEEAETEEDDINGQEAGE